MNRRSFLKATIAGAAAAPFGALIRAQESKPGVRRGHTVGYGPLFPTPDEATGLPLLLLPQGFKYRSFGWTRDPLDNGSPTPGAHDGMAAFDAGNGIVRLVRNHEQQTGTPFSTSFYDAANNGGTTTLDYDLNKGQVVSSYGSLSGTIRNCAGGSTPWGSWLTCEETIVATANKPHGYIFDVPTDGFGDPTPLKAMGRFSHEAVAVDPTTGYVYETEDQGSTSGFYRFVPNVPGVLSAGGKLYMMRVVGENKKDLFGVLVNGTTYDVAWVLIDNPNTDVPPPMGQPPLERFVSAQGRAKEAAYFGRLEGCWYGNDAKIYFVSTSGGGGGRGQVWEYDPANEVLRLVFQSPGAEVLNAPDNICVSPRGGLVLCEDGDGDQFLHGLTVDGEIFPFAKNNVILNGEKNGFSDDYTDQEFAGACFSPDGHWLLVNIQTPGITFAITGPWESGAL